jgi:hypothetical protein
MNEPDEEQDLKDLIATQAGNLMDEFVDHYDDVSFHTGKYDLDSNKVFQGWILQKLASLQILAMESLRENSGAEFVRNYKELNKGRLKC